MIANVFPAGPCPAGKALWHKVYWSEAPQAEPQAVGFSAGLSAAPQAEPQAEGFSAGLSAAPQADPQAAGLSPAPQAVPEACEEASLLFHSKRLESAIIMTSGKLFRSF